MAKKLKEFDERQRSDHDMLVRLETKVDGLIIDVKDLKEDLINRIVELENMHSGFDTKEEVRINRQNKNKIEELEFRWKIVVFLLAPLYIAAIGSFVEAIGVNLF